MKLDLTPLLDQLNRIESNQAVILSKLALNPDTPPVPDQPAPPTVELPAPPIAGMIDITDQWYETFGTGWGYITLEAGKTYILTTVRTLRMTGEFGIKVIGNDPAFLWIGKKRYLLYIDEGENTTLFLLDDGAKCFIKNVNASMQEQDRNVQQMYQVNWFESVQNENAKWEVTLEDVDTTFLGRNGGLGIGRLYGGIHENKVRLINYRHAGPMLMELKNPYPNGVIWFIGKNVNTDYNDPHNWSRRAHLTKGIIKDNILNLTGEVGAVSLYNHFFLTDTGANRSFIVHVGRFTFMIDTIGAVIDDKTIRLRPVPKKTDLVVLKRGRFFFPNREPHPSDTFSIQGRKFTIVEKIKTENDEWTNNFGRGNSPLTVKNPACFVAEKIDIIDGEYLLESYNSTFDINNESELYLIYKDDLNFRTQPHTKFGDDQVLLAKNGGHIVYNHRSISIWADDVHLEGYYRESTQGHGKSLGYNIVNSTGFDDEFSKDKVITTDIPMP